MLGPIISGILSLGTQYLSNRQEISKAKAKAKTTKIESEGELRKKALDHEGAWETLQAEASKGSWKDEAWTIFFIAILVAGFVPDFRETLDQWVAFVDSLPEWVSLGIIISISASFGIRGVQSLLGKKK